MSKTKSKKYRVPRKIKKQIPKGVYCYEYIKPNLSEKGIWKGYETKPCPFGKYIKLKDSPDAKDYTKKELDDFGDELIDWCKIAECSIDDSCKSCGIKNEF